MPSLSYLYLFAYNSLQAFGWAFCLVRILGDFISTGTVNGAYASAGDLICLMQVSAFLEVIHGAIGGTGAEWDAASFDAMGRKDSRHFDHY
ncbi:hypothetical protein TIFTF001_000514 [Ficus carica]|uniref:very-long-chain (3R)-3-hydroxyacyl-CoA dehydratase n=1 Tax=Ficus carica TaxID=3494 RepID=A0AA88CP89_FICCA|nr:hypothetical protein TIFTF001_000514 [Ficus carica]